MAAIPGGSAIPPDAQAAVKAADVIVNLDWVDLGGVFKVTFGDEMPKAKVISITNDFRIHRGWSMDYQGLPVGRRAAAGDARRGACPRSTRRSASP